LGVSKEGKIRAADAFWRIYRGLKGIDVPDSIKNWTDNPVLSFSFVETCQVVSGFLEYLFYLSMRLFCLSKRFLPEFVILNQFRKVVLTEEGLVVKRPHIIPHKLFFTHPSPSKGKEKFNQSRYRGLNRRTACPDLSGRIRYYTIRVRQLKSVVS
jgi:hypothetical protein